jgi:RimJ/RimL family protein N-acetyltransferase
MTLSTTTPTIADFDRFAPAELYRLFADVYASAEGMSETLAEKYAGLPGFEADLAALRRLPGAVAVAAAVAQIPLAYAIIRPRKPSRLRHTADLSMGVAGSARGQGLGAGVLHAALARAAAESVLEIVYLMVRADNAPAMRLYARAGFETLAVLDRDTRIDDRYFDGVLMRKLLGR